ncbi:hypothetical protein CEE39_03075 [bacterium (candidate division B38) B3_B38]|nr:MAG: hypothetical protein CEE39_03075 [bacterium (candidate division B38) B3_B38]
MSLPVQKQESIAPGYWLLSLHSPQIASAAAPGQFVMLKIDKSFDPLLPRPMSIHSVIKEDNNRIGFTILYKVMGKGTRLLSEKRSGESLVVIGPLGKGFNLNHISSGCEPIVVGGGIGIAPLLFLAHKLLERGWTPSVLLGANSQQELLRLDEFESSGLIPKVSTEDGSKGVKGMVTDLLGSYLEDRKGVHGEVFACGPSPMLEKVASQAKEYGLNSQLSLEQRMACGLGACLGCVVRIRDKEGSQLSFQRVCTEGPVFNGEDIIW